MQYFRSRLTCVENILNFHLRRNFYILQFYKKKYAAFPLISLMYFVIVKLHLNVFLHITQGIKVQKLHLKVAYNLNIWHKIILVAPKV